MSVFNGFRNKLNVHHFTFNICDPFALDMMHVLFERIKNAVWPDRERYPLVHRSKFNGSFRNLSLWAADFGYADLRRFREVFEKFTEDLGATLQTVKVRFTDIDCGIRKGKLYVRLKPDPASMGVLRRLQGDLIMRFGDIQEPGFVKLYDLHCNLLYLDTEVAFENVECVIRECFREFGHFEAQLGPFLVCQDCQVIHQYPMSAQKYWGPTEDTPEWVTRSLCIFNIPHDCEIDPSKIIVSLATLIGFELDTDMMIESCGPRFEYNTLTRRGRIVAVFRTIFLRDSFFRMFKRYLSRNDWRIAACDVLFGISGRDIFIRKSLPPEEEWLNDLAVGVCALTLRQYRVSRDEATGDIYLEQRDEPRWQYHFKTAEELNNLANLLRYGSGTEYLSSVW